MKRVLTAEDVYRRFTIRGLTLREAAKKWRDEHVAAGNMDYAEPMAEVTTPKLAYVNEGRWLIQCECGNCVPVLERHNPTEAVCFSCGVIWTRVLFPPNRDMIEAALLRRRWRRNQNWHLNETLQQLHDENDEHRATEGVL